LTDLRPAPFGHLLRRLVRELEQQASAFDLPARKFWRATPGFDTSVRFHRRPAATPLGPAAGPQDQLAQNIVLAWLGGSRIFELKTVQINDRLAIPRPCIDATNVGYNVEWSQELRLLESLREYVKGSMLLDALRQGGLPHVPAESGTDTILDMSVGYDLAGIQSPQVRSWITSMKEASADVAAVRDEIPDDLRRFRDLDYTTRLSTQITLSTFHGCPAGEIEGIVRFLLTEMDVDVTVKLNPTLLGREAVDGLLHDVLGYTEIETRPLDFAKDLQWEQALEITDRLTEVALGEGRRFQVKFSNTLVVKNHRPFFPASEEVMYLSGGPLHVVTLNLVQKFRQARPDVPISFSAGVDAQNFADCVALGFTPITTCTDLLRPGGYARLPAYLQKLEERMKGATVRKIPELVIRACGQGAAAIADVVPPGPLRERALQWLGVNGPLTDVLGAEVLDQVAAAAARRNTPLLVEKATRDPRYAAPKNRIVPKKIGSFLWTFDCISCDKCVPVCPNDANFVYETTPTTTTYENYLVRGEGAVAVPGGTFEVKKAHQIANFQDFCNECGNCDVFCPEDGGPYVEKPRFFGTLDDWLALTQRDGFFARRTERDEVHGRIRGVEYLLLIDRAQDRAVFTDGRITLELAHGERRTVRAAVEPGTPDGHVLDFTAYLNMALIAQGVLDARHANPVNAAQPLENPA
jgi:putative selenate reductase